MDPRNEEQSETLRKAYEVIERTDRTLADVNRMLFLHHLGVILRFVGFLTCCYLGGVLLYGTWLWWLGEARLVACDRAGERFIMNGHAG